MTHAGEARRFLAVVTMAGLMLVTACSTDEAGEATRHETAVAAGEATESVEALFNTEVKLFRRYTGSKWRLDKDHVFTVKDESHVRAEVEFRNIQPARTYSVHLAWIRPDGKEMFRRYAEITRHEVSLPLGAVPDSTGALPASVTSLLETNWGKDLADRLAALFVADPETVVPVTERIYKKAVDLGYARRNISLAEEAAFELTTNLNISREKERLLGPYLLRIYLDRRLLREIPFEVQDPTAEPDPVEIQD